MGETEPLWISLVFKQSFQDQNWARSELLIKRVPLEFPKYSGFSQNYRLLFIK